MLLVKILKLASLFFLGALLGLGVASFRASRANADHATELAALRASLDRVRETEKKAVLQREQLENEVDRLRQQSANVHRLRAEVSRLKSETDSDPITKAKASGDASPIEAEGEIPMESAPPVIQATLLREFGDTLAKRAMGRFKDEKGRTTYGFKGQLSDGRAVSMVMGEDGSVLEKSLEIPADTVPANIQTTAVTFFGEVAISGIREIREAGNIRYELTADATDSGRMQMTVDGDGTILNYWAKFRRPGK